MSIEAREFILDPEGNQAQPDGRQILGGRYLLDPQTGQQLANLLRKIEEAASQTRTDFNNDTSKRES